MFLFVFRVGESYVFRLLKRCFPLSLTSLQRYNIGIAVVKCLGIYFTKYVNLYERGSRVVSNFFDYALRYKRKFTIYNCNYIL